MNLSSYTGSDYANKNPTWHAEDSAWKAAHIFSLLKDNGLRPKNIGEVGCGAGEILFELSKKMPDTIFHGYEISPYAYSLCQKKADDRRHFYLEDLTQKTQVNLDVLLVMDVIEHVTDYMGFLEKIRSKAQTFIFHIPLDLSVQTVARKKRLLSVRHSVGHLHYFTRETALATLTESGYIIQAVRMTTPAADLPERSFLALLMRVPRKIFFALAPNFAARWIGGGSILILAK